MTVDEKTGLILVDQIHKGLEAPVDKILLVAQTPRGRMGQNDVHSLKLAQLPPQLADPAAHLLFRVLMGAAVIERAAAQSHDPQSLHADQIPVDTVTALRRDLLIAAVVIAVDIE